MDVNGQLHTPPLYPQEGTLVPTELEGGWVPEPVWIFWRIENHLTLPGLEPRIVQSVTKPTTVTRQNVISWRNGKPHKSELFS